MKLLRQFVASSRTSPRVIVALAVLSALATTAVLAVVNTAANQPPGQGVSLRLLAIMGLATATFALCQGAVARIIAQEAERMIFRLRVGLFEDIRRANLSVLDTVGRAGMHAALTRNMQSISRNLPMAVIGLQQMVMLVCVSLYMVALSPAAFALAAVFGAATVAVHLTRMAPVNAATQRAAEDDARLFDGLRDLLLGFKEVRMSRARAAAMREDLAALSDDARVTKAALRRRWGQEFALVQLMFYLLVGLMVFVVPLFTTEYHAVVVKATTTALFMIGPIGTVTQLLPSLSSAESALVDMEEKRRRLGAMVEAQADEAAEPLPGPLQTVELRDARFAYRDAGGQAGFSVGPVSVSLRTGELVFITGGNGSGKSTLLRLLTALEPPSDGTVLVNGAALAPGQRQAYRDTISAVFGDYHLFRRLYGIDPVEAAARAPGLLERLEMHEKVSIGDGAFSTIDLSQGQRKRLALVVAELEDRPILVLDEWAADQDPHFRAVFYDEILPDLRARGKLVLCVTHDDRWFHRADRILHMVEGRLTAAAPPPPPPPAAPTLEDA